MTAARVNTADLPRVRRGRILKLSVCLLCLTALTVAPQFILGAETPLGRRTTDRHADLVEGMLAEGMVDAAEAICRRHLASTPRGSEAQATWAIRLASVLVARAQAQGADDDALWDAAAESVEAAIAGYESARMAPWLSLQRLLVDLARGELRTMRFLANPADSPLRDQATELLGETIAGLRALDVRLDDMIPLAGAGRLPEAASQADLLTLQQTVRRQIASALLTKSRAFPAESDDALAAATEAEQAAQRLLESVSPTSPHRESVVRVLAEAQRRAQQPAEAARILQGWVRSGAAEPATIAEFVLAELQQGEVEPARAVLEQYYGDAPSEAPPSVDMDLARLRFLVSQADTSSESGRGEISTWVEAIGERGGAYARRRAEIEMLGSLRVAPSTGNVTLMVAQAGQMLRSGDKAQMIRAATLLQQAAELSAGAGEQPRAFQLGAQAGAALVQAGEPAAASRAFARAASEHPAEPQSSAVHFEAARLLAAEISGQETTDAGATLDRIEQLLFEHLRLWPQAREAFAAREWLLRILRAAEQNQQAAEVAVRLPAESPEWEKAVPLAAELWREAAVQQEPGAARESVALRGVGALRQIAGLPVMGLPVMGLPIVENAVEGGLVREPSEALAVAIPADAGARRLAVEHANLLAVLGLERDAVQQVWSELAGDVPASQQSPLALATDLRRVRLEAVDPEGVALSSTKLDGQEAIVDLALWRLHSDAMQRPEYRSLAGRAMLRISDGHGPGGSERQIYLAEALAWSGKWSEAAARLVRLAESQPDGAIYLRRGAELLASVDDPAARAQAIDFWNRLAAGVPQGSVAWHQAKLGAAEGMLAGGDAKAASKLARYVLLTQPPDDPELKTRYQRIAESGDR